VTERELARAAAHRSAMNFRSDTFCRPECLAAPVITVLPAARTKQG
jgi:hypothetical protein